MKSVQSLFIIILSLFSLAIYAAPISIGPYALDTDAGATSSSFTGSVFENTDGAITDSLVNTYIKGDSADASVALTFDNIALSNQTGNDLALFFLFADNTVTLDINGVSSEALNSSQLFVNPDDPFTDSLNQKYLVKDILLPDGSLGIADLAVLFVDLDNFAVDLNQSITNINIGLGINSPLLTYAIGLHPAPTAVPLPVPLILLATGLTMLAAFAKRKHSS